jgi:membrane protease subunit HflK
MIGLVFVFLGSGFFTVGPQEKAIKLRLGRPVGEGEQALLGAGLHWSLPYPIDEVIKVPITEIQRVESTVGWFAQTPEQRALNQELPTGNSLNPAIDGYVLTADGNIIHTRAILSYRIQDPIRSVFGFAGDTNQMFSLAGVSNAVQNALDNALIFAASRFKVDDVLTRDIAGFKDAVRRHATELLEQREAGVVIEQCDVESRPPRQLRDAFTGVLQAEVARVRALDDARSYENQVLSKGGADAAARINSAESERTRQVSAIAAEAARFVELLPKYQANPELFTLQRLTEVLGRTLASVEKNVLPSRVNGKPVELRLLLNREPQKPKTESPAQP